MFNIPPPAGDDITFLIRTFDADNVAFYARNNIPFVVGTTGGDREKLMQDAKTGNSYAVIAPQMGKQVTISHRLPSKNYSGYRSVFSFYSCLCQSFKAVAALLGAQQLRLRHRAAL